VVGVVYGVERILDMSRTTLNVCGDLTAAVYVARTESEWDPASVGTQVKIAA
jgi:DAACS family dicarboxylate/amino acid:cation (Na+ or H+) symporter